MSILSIGTAWDEAKEALKRSRRLIVPVALGMVLLPAVIAAMVEPRTATGEQPPAGPWMLVVLAMVVVMLLAQLTLVLLVNGWRGSLGEAIGQAGKRLPVLLLTVVLIAIPAMFVMAFVIAIVAAGPGGDGGLDPASISPAGWLAMLLFALVLLFISVRLLPTVAVIAEGRLGPIASLRRSFALTSGNFWKLLAFVVLIVLAFMVVALAIGGVVGSIVSVLFGAAEPWSVSLLLLALTSGVVQAAFVAFYTAMIARITAQLERPRA